jgi:transposase
MNDWSASRLRHGAYGTVADDLGSGCRYDQRPSREVRAAARRLRRISR